jgi:carnitine 3-dehydrogenase
MDVPELDDALLDKIVAQSDAQAGAAGIRELERLRDDCLVAVLQGLRSRDYAAGATLDQFEKTLWAKGHRSGFDIETGDLSKPLRLHETRVEPGWVDFNNHMTESRYLQVFGDATESLFRVIGVDQAYHRAGHNYYTVETHLRHLREVEGGTPLHVTTQILGADEKRIHLFHSLYRSDNDTLLATAEQMQLHVDMRASRAAPALPEVLARVERIAAAHRGLERPAGSGRSISLGK